MKTFSSFYDVNCVISTSDAQQMRTLYGSELEGLPPVAEWVSPSFVFSAAKEDSPGAATCIFVDPLPLSCDLAPWGEALALLALHGKLR